MKVAQLNRLLFTAIACFLACILPALAHAEEGDTLLLTSQPETGQEATLGGRIEYSVLFMDELEELNLRIRVSSDLTLGEGSVFVVPASVESMPEIEIIWGNDGALLTLKNIHEKDILCFDALVSEQAIDGTVLTCTVETENESCLANHAAVSAPVETPSPTPTPEQVSATASDTTTSLSPAKPEVTQKSELQLTMLATSLMLFQLFSVLITILMIIKRRTLGRTEKQDSTG